MPSRAIQLPTGRAILFVLLLLGLLVLVGQHSLASVVAKRNPELALRIAPGHAEAAGLVALRSMTATATAGDIARARRLAQSALRSEPLSAVAAGALGLANDRRGQTALARRQIAFSEQLSRRELVVQLWLIEDAVARDDIPGALRRYDTAMRTSRDALGILFPILIGAIDDPAIRAPLADILARRPSWSTQFVQQLAQSGTAFDSINQLYRALRQRGAPVSDLTLATVTTRMVERGQVAGAWTLFQSYRPGADRRGLRNGSFDQPLADATPFDWSRGPESEIVVEQRPAFDGPALYFETPMGVGGVAARQLLLLSPGAVSIRAMASDTAGLGDNLPYLRLACADGRRELGRQAFPSVGPEGQPFKLDAVVPRDCPAQWIEVVAQAADSLGGAAGYIDNVSLSR